MQCVIGLFLVFTMALVSKERVLSLGEHGSVRYLFEGEQLIEVNRLNAENEVIYSHTYRYGEGGKLIAEGLIGGLGDLIHDGDRVVCPVSEEVCEYDENHNLVKHIIDGVSNEYTYDANNKMITQDDRVFYQRDEDGDTTYIADNVYFYDDVHQLVKVVTPHHVVEYEYDPYGNRACRVVDGEIEYFLYSGTNEIAILDGQGDLKQLRIPGISMHPDVLRPVAIETQAGVFAPIHDYQGKIIKLINIATREVIRLDGVDPFGKGIPEDLPTSWVFCGKNYDRETGLVYFGKRYYSPSLREWVTKDPLCQTENPYEFCLGNPPSYFDPDGQWAVSLLSVAWGAGATVTAPFWGPYAIAGAAGAAAAYYGYKAYGYWQERNSAQDLQKQIQKDQAPASVDRADKGRGPFEKDHVHFKDDNALNHDGTWKHGEKSLTKKEKEWLEKNGWKIPEGR